MKIEVFGANWLEVELVRTIIQDSAEKVGNRECVERIVIVRGDAYGGICTNGHVIPPNGLSGNDLLVIAISARLADVLSVLSEEEAWCWRRGSCWSCQEWEPFKNHRGAGFPRTVYVCFERFQDTNEAVRVGEAEKIRTQIASLPDPEDVRARIRAVMDMIKERVHEG